MGSWYDVLHNEPTWNWTRILDRWSHACGNIYHSHILTIQYIFSSWRLVVNVVTTPLDELIFTMNSCASRPIGLYCILYFVDQINRLMNNNQRLSSQLSALVMFQLFLGLVIVMCAVVIIIIFYLGHAQMAKTGSNAKPHWTMPRATNQTSG